MPLSAMIKIAVVFGVAIGVIFFRDQPIEYTLQMIALFGVIAFAVILLINVTLKSRHIEDDDENSTPRKMLFPDFCQPGDLCKITFDDGDPDTLFVEKRNASKVHLSAYVDNHQKITESGWYRRLGNSWKAERHPQLI